MVQYERGQAGVENNTRAVDLGCRVATKNDEFAQVAVFLSVETIDSCWVCTKSQYGGQRGQR